MKCRVILDPHGEEEVIIRVRERTPLVDSLERLAEECEVSKETVKRAIKRNSFIYKYLPGDELKTE